MLKSINLFFKHILFICIFLFMLSFVNSTANAAEVRDVHHILNGKFYSNYWLVNSSDSKVGRLVLTGADSKYQNRYSATHYFVSQVPLHFNYGDSLEIDVEKGGCEIILFKQNIYPKGTGYPPVNFLTEGIDDYCVQIGEINKGIKVNQSGDYYIGLSLMRNTTTNILSLFIRHSHQYTYEYYDNNGNDKGMRISRCACGNINETAYLLWVNKGQGIESVTEKQYRKAGDTVTLDAVQMTGYKTPQYSGYTTNDTFVMPEKHIYINANAYPNSGMLYIDPNGGSYAGYNSIYCIASAYGKAANIKLPDRPYYTFKGWKFSGDNGFLTTKDNATTYTFGPNDGGIDRITAIWEENEPAFIANMSPSRYSGTYKEGNILKLSIETAANTAKTIKWEKSYDNQNWIEIPDLKNKKSTDIKFDFNIDNQHLYYRVTLDNDTLTCSETAAFLIKEADVEILEQPYEISVIEGIPTTIAISAAYNRETRWEISTDYNEINNTGHFQAIDAFDGQSAPGKNETIFTWQKPRLINESDTQSIYYLRCILKNETKETVSDIIRIVVNSKKFKDFSVLMKNKEINYKDNISQEDITVILNYDNGTHSVLNDLSTLYFNKECTLKIYRCNEIGNKTISVWYMDNLGNIYESVNKIDFSVKDISAPMISDLKLKWADGTEFNGIEENCTKKELYLSVIASDNDDNLKYIFSRNMNTGENSSLNSDNTISVTENGTYYVKVIDSAGNISKEKSITINAWDFEKPYIYSYTISPEGYSKYKKLKIAARDNNKLSDKAYSFDGGNTFQSSDEFIITENGIIDVRVKDFAGNISEGYSLDDNKDGINITGIDNDSPVIENVVSVTKTLSENNTCKVFAIINAHDATSAIFKYAYDSNMNGKIDKEEWIFTINGEIKEIPIDYDRETNGYNRLFAVSDEAGNNSYTNLKINAYVPPYADTQELIDKEVKSSAYNIPDVDSNGNKLYTNASHGVLIGFNLENMNSESRENLEKHYKWSSSILSYSDEMYQTVHKNDKYYVELYGLGNNYGNNKWGTINFEVNNIDDDAPIVNANFDNKSKRLIVSAYDGMSGIAAIHILGGENREYKLVEEYSDVKDINGYSGISKASVHIPIYVNDVYQLKVVDSVGNSTVKQITVNEISELDAAGIIPVFINDSNIASPLNGSSYTTDDITLTIKIPEEMKNSLDEYPFSWDMGKTYTNETTYVIKRNGQYSLWIKLKSDKIVRFDNIFVNNIDNEPPVLTVYSLNNHILIEGFDSKSGINRIIVKSPVEKVIIYDDLEKYRLSDGKISIDHETYVSGEYIVEAYDNLNNKSSYSVTVGTDMVLSKELFSGFLSVEYEGAGAESNGYSNTSAKISIALPDNIKAYLDLYPYKWEKDNSFSAEKSRYTDKNGEYKIDIKTASGEIISGISCKVDKLDKTAPNLIINANDNTIFASAIDGGCGMKEIIISNPETGIIAKGGELRDDGTFVLTSSELMAGEYTVYARDLLGNEALRNVNIVTKLISIAEPEEVKIENGIFENELVNYLPHSIDVVTTDKKINSLEVEYDDLHYEYGTSYNPYMTSSQSFVVSGNVKIPEGIIYSIKSPKVYIKVKTDGAVEGKHALREESQFKQDATQYENDSQLIKNINERAVVSLNKKAYEYTGNEIYPKVSIIYKYQEYNDLGSYGKLKKMKLTENSDYKLEYINNRDAGTGKVKIIGIGDFKGEIIKSFSISKKNINKCKVKYIPNLKYTGDDLSEEISSAIEIFDGKKKLCKKDYSFSFNEVPVGRFGENTDISFRISSSEAGNYCDVLKGTYKVKIIGKPDNMYNLSSAEIMLADPEKSLYFNGFEICPKIKVYIKNKEVTSSDFIVKYNNNMHAGKAEVYVEGINNGYGKSASISFDILPQDMSMVKIKGISNMNYRSNIADIKPRVYLGRYLLKEGIDYSFGTNEEIDKKLTGQKSAKIAFKFEGLDNGDMTGKKLINITVLPRNIKSRFSTNVIISDAYIDDSGNCAIPDIKVTYNNQIIELGKDYIVSFKGNDKAGKYAKAIITGINNYYGKRIVKFKVLNTAK